MEVPESVEIVQSTMEVPESVEIVQIPMESRPKEVPESVEIVQSTMEVPESMEIIQSTMEVPESVEIVQNPMESRPKDVPESVQIIQVAHRRRIRFSPTLDSSFISICFILLHMKRLNAMFQEIKTRCTRLGNFLPANYILPHYQPIPIHQ
ncbi:hypothetical protein TNCV_3033231 [Trichonephila clavipes]|nr:hypothetical protein TNCV_3033231 [Trichonephila clavipes]